MMAENITPVDKDIEKLGKEAFEAFDNLVRYQMLISDLCTIFDRVPEERDIANNLKAAVFTAPIDETLEARDKFRTLLDNLKLRKEEKERCAAAENECNAIAKSECPESLQYNIEKEVLARATKKPQSYESDIGSKKNVGLSGTSKFKKNKKCRKKTVKNGKKNVKDVELPNLEAISQTTRAEIGSTENELSIPIKGSEFKREISRKRAERSLLAVMPVISQTHSFNEAQSIVSDIGSEKSVGYLALNSDEFESQKNKICRGKAKIGENKVRDVKLPNLEDTLQTTKSEMGSPENVGHVALSNPLEGAQFKKGKAKPKRSAAISQKCSFNKPRSDFGSEKKVVEYSEKTSQFQKNEECGKKTEIGDEKNVELPNLEDMLRSTRSEVDVTKNVKDVELPSSEEASVLKKEISREKTEKNALAAMPVTSQKHTFNESQSNVSDIGSKKNVEHVALNLEESESQKNKKCRGKTKIGENKVRDDTFIKNKKRNYAEKAKRNELSEISQKDSFNDSKLKHAIVKLNGFMADPSAGNGQGIAQSKKTYCCQYDPHHEVKKYATNDVKNEEIFKATESKNDILPSDTMPKQNPKESLSAALDYHYGVHKRPYSLFPRNLESPVCGLSVPIFDLEGSYFNSYLYNDDKLFLSNPPAVLTCSEPEAITNESDEVLSESTSSEQNHVAEKQQTFKKTSVLTPVIKSCKSCASAL